MSVNIYLNFDGNCRDAVMFYADVFELGAPKIMTFSEGPQDPNYPLPEEAKDRIMHTFLPIAGSMVMFSDTFPGMNLVQGNNMSLTVVTSDMDAIKRWFEKMQVGATVQMPLQETFWSKCYGALTDQYGINWQFSHESETTE